MPSVAKRLQDTIECKLGFRPGVILRTTSEMKDVIARNPFVGRDEIEPGKLVITFLGSSPDSGMREAVLALTKATGSKTSLSAKNAKKMQRMQRTSTGEELWMNGRELFVYFPDGMGRSKLVPQLERALKKSGTGRNWNTVTKLLEMAKTMESTS